jgi:polyhydroxyalkanoate synthesis regulator phasin
MSYKESFAECGWCSKVLSDRSEVACRKCHEELEEKVAELERKIEELEAQT